MMFDDRVDAGQQLAGRRSPVPVRPTEAGLPSGTWHALADYLADWRASLRRADRACCCPARPAVVVIMPPAGARRDPIDLLLCHHHCRIHAAALAMAGAAVLDTGGRPLTPETFLLLHVGG
jgi:hypothetical protein